MSCESMSLVVNFPLKSTTSWWTSGGTKNVTAWVVPSWRNLIAAKKNHSVSEGNILLARGVLRTLNCVIL
jgi:hypothetical protein